MSKQVTALALDAGQTGIRTLLISGSQSVSDKFEGLRTDIDLFPQLAAVINEVVKGSGPSVHLAIGMTGLTQSESKPESLLKLLSPNVLKVDLVHDSVSGFLGTMGLNLGVVTAVGTGVVTLGVGHSKIARVDGWGNLIGDAGSAYWIGRAGLEAAMKSYDGRTDKSQLETLLENFSHPEEAYIELQTDVNRVALIASFAKAVTEIAESDATAKDIVQRAGSELALSAVTAAKRVGLLDEGSPRFSWTGNVMKADLLKNSFVDSLLKRLPAATLQEPIAEPIDGVALIPSLPADSPLREAVYSAERDASH